LGILSPLLSFQKAIGPLNGDSVSQNSANSNPTLVNGIHKNTDSDKSSEKKMSIEEFQTYFDFSKSCLDAEQHRVLLEFFYEYADLLSRKESLLGLQMPWKWTLSSPQMQLHSRQNRTGLLLK
jgi:hypothetical protein